MIRWGVVAADMIGLSRVVAVVIGAIAMPVLVSWVVGTAFESVQQHGRTGWGFWFFAIITGGFVLFIVGALSLWAFEGLTFLRGRWFK